MRTSQMRCGAAMMSAIAAATYGPGVRSAFRASRSTSADKDAARESAAVFDRALAKRPEDRFSTAGELAQAFEALLETVTLPLPPPQGETTPLSSASAGGVSAAPRSAPPTSLPAVPMTPPTPAAPTVAMALCSCTRTKKPYLLHFQYETRNGATGWFAAQTSELSPQRASQGGYGTFQARGPVYSGAPCPHCGAASFLPVHDKLTCWDGHTNPAPCAFCAEKHRISEGKMQSIDSAKQDF